MKYNDRAVLVAKYGMLIALACIFSYIEAINPIPFPIPGVKLGLANLVNVVGLYVVGIPGTIAVSLIRILLMGFTFSNPSSLIYSMAGGALSLILMVTARKSGWFGKVGVSVIGGIGHNIGQIAAAAWMVKTTGVFYYLPMLLIAGVIAGAIIGVLGGLVVERIQGVVKKV